MKTILLSLLAVLAASATLVAGPVPVTNLNDALAKAKEGNKLVFLQFGREACGNCQALRSYIKGGKVNLAASKFVYADLNCDDSSTSKAFYQKFKVIGSTLPFVVIASLDGRQLATRTGYGSANEYLALIKKAEKAAKEQ